MPLQICIVNVLLHFNIELGTYVSMIFFSGRGWARACWINIHTDRAGKSDRHRCGASNQHISTNQKLHLLHSHRHGHLTIRISFSLHLFGMLRSGMQKQVRTLTFIKVIPDPEGRCTTQYSTSGSIWASRVGFNSTKLF